MHVTSRTTQKRFNAQEFSSATMKPSSMLNLRGQGLFVKTVVNLVVLFK
ncbi:hypothetical protein [Acinetobacter seifertii]|nr:hypothetical protein [Acinetobacter seifertii]